jgi:hypothetical protein
MTEFDLDRFCELVLEKASELMKETLLNYQEIVVNCHYYDEEEQPRGYVLYDEVDAELPVVTTSERLVEELIEELSNFMSLAIQNDLEVDHFD